MGCHCPDAAPLAGYIYPVLTRRGLRGIASRGSLCGLGLGQAIATPQEYANAVADYIAAGGSMTAPPAPVSGGSGLTTEQAYLAAGGGVPFVGSSQAVNAQGQTMADVLAAGGSPADLGPTTSDYNYGNAANMQTSWAGSIYGAASDAASAAANAFTIPWWIWAVAGAVGVVMLADVVKK